MALGDDAAWCVCWVCFLQLSFVAFARRAALPVKTWFLLPVLPVA